MVWEESPLLFTLSYKKDSEAYLNFSFFELHNKISPRKKKSLLDRKKAQLIKLKTAMEQFFSKLAVEKIIIDKVSEVWERIEKVYTINKFNASDYDKCNSFYSYLGIKNLFC